MESKTSDIMIQIEREERRLKSSILKSREGSNETIIQTLFGTNEKTKIIIIVAGLILLIAVAVTLGLFIGLLEQVTIDDNQETTKTLSKACQGNTVHCCPFTLALYNYTKFHFIALKLSLI